MLSPHPGRKSREGIWSTPSSACCTKSVWTPTGRHLAYILLFIHLGSRKVFVSSSTYHPDAEWIQQQARNVTMWAEDEGLDLRFLIRDRDTKFTEA